MNRHTLLVVLLLALFTSLAGAQTEFQQNEQTDPAQKQEGIRIDFSVGDTTLIHQLLTGSLLNESLNSLLHPHSVFDLDSNDEVKDSVGDSLIYELRIGKMFHKYGKGRHSFLITNDPFDRLLPYGESFSMIDFNRVNGFFLGLATPFYINFGRHDELGIKGGIGYGFEEQKGQSMLGGEYRLPLGTIGDTSVTVEHWRWTPTLAFGAEYHDITTTEDAWRASRSENAFYAFFAREDFRDYFKIDGWNAHIAFRPNQHAEISVIYESDINYDEPQRVFHGRWGGDKTLPDNPAVTTGRINSWLISAGEEKVTTETKRVTNIFGDNVVMEYLSGRAYLFQAEFGSREDTTATFDFANGGKTYAKYSLDARDFNPITKAINFDTRLRIETETGNVPIQKMSYLGGPSSLPAFKNKVFAGNRMLLLNTEVRLSLEELSSFFDESNAEIIVLNDFGYIDLANPGDDPLGGFNNFKLANIIYNVGIGIGHASGIQLGVDWRTDVKETGRFFFRFQRSF
ncbi:MAG TPA: hypothetical protein VEW28_11010 [Candidatus Kapabacteria bacterium]|nr:hypothetical protein [Candidatus Kapabacteria bacterium]